MKKLFVALALLLLVLHQDFWFWDDATLVFGFMPVGLAYHAGYSLLAAVLWAMCAEYAWPTDLEKWADEGEEGEGA